jgi:hypothetical protein
VRRGIVAIDPTAEDRDRVTVPLECAAVRVAVDASCHAADDDDPGGG